MAVTRVWKVYGAFGHRQRASFGPSAAYDWGGPWKHKESYIEKCGRNGYE